MKTNLLLADGRKLLREGLSALLEKHTDVKVVGEAEDGQSAARLLRPLSVDVVILNLAPPARSGSEAIRTLVNAKPDVKVVVLAHTPASHTVKELLGAGATGCLTRDCAADELLTAIRTVTSGRRYLGAHLMDTVVQGYVDPGRPRGGSTASKSLAPREREILRQIAAGKGTKEIAASLRVTTKTIETHRRRLMEKLNLHSVAELTKYAVMQGISPLEISTVS